ncbi:MAG TPA: aspartate-semialdehyde dehydrogenase [Firmicutes bacterium]|nr:aspartate-semialdehyde dehydrogenase [Bacillota bacterium]
MKKYNVAVVGATGMVGRTFLRVLAERKFPISKIKLLASRRSAGKKVDFNGKECLVEELTPSAFEGVDFAFFSAGSEISKTFAPEAVARGVQVIDNSNAFRMDPEVPLVVPEVNPEEALKNKGIIANPNCSTIQMVVVLNPLHQAAKLKRVVVSTYQAVSGAGKAAVDGLYREAARVLAREDAEPANLPHAGAKKYHQIAFNMVPQIDVFVEDGYTKEEMKMINESRKILNLPDLRITATTVRVPVEIGHSESVNLEFEEPLPVEEAKEILRRAPEIVVMDDPAELDYPMPFYMSGRDEVFVGRLRPDKSVASGLNLWIVADNIRKGAATNSIQIAELLL